MGWIQRRTPEGFSQVLASDKEEFSAEIRQFVNTLDPELTFLDNKSIQEGIIPLFLKEI